MPYNALTDDLQILMNQMNQRLTALETGNPLANACIQGGFITLLDSTGTVKGYLGILPDGSMGLGIPLIAGSQSVVNVAQALYHEFDEVTAVETTTATGWNDLATVGPSVTQTVTSTGRMLITWGAQVTPGTYSAGESALVGVFVDGNFANYAFTVSNENSGTSVQTPGVAMGIIDNLTAGTHTVELKYGVTTVGVSATFANRWLKTEAW